MSYQSVLCIVSNVSALFSWKILLCGINETNRRIKVRIMIRSLVNIFFDSRFASPLTKFSIRIADSWFESGESFSRFESRQTNHVIRASLATTWKQNKKLGISRAKQKMIFLKSQHGHGSYFISSHSVSLQKQYFYFISTVWCD